MKEGFDMDWISGALAFALIVLVIRLIGIVERILLRRKSPWLFKDEDCQDNK